MYSRLGMYYLAQQMRSDPRAGSHLRAAAGAKSEPELGMMLRLGAVVGALVLAAAFVMWSAG